MAEKKEKPVVAIARSGFLMDGEHIETGTELELEFGFFRLLETAGKVMRKTDPDPATASKRSKSKGNADGDAGGPDTGAGGASA